MVIPFVATLSKWIVSLCVSASPNYYWWSRIRSKILLLLLAVHRFCSLLVLDILEYICKILLLVPEGCGPIRAAPLTCTEC